MRISDWSSDVCSSDLGRWRFGGRLGGRFGKRDELRVVVRRQGDAPGLPVRLGLLDPLPARRDEVPPDEALAERLARSEEHTSELQSLMRISYAVFCLKKKRKLQNITTNTHLKT